MNQTCFVCILVIVGVIRLKHFSDVVGVTSNRFPSHVMRSPASGVSYGRAEVRPMKSTGLTSTINPFPVSMYCGARLLRRSVMVAEDAPRIYTQDSPANASSVSVILVAASSKPVVIADLSVRQEQVQPVQHQASSSR
jgi:hypothetical protein